MFPGQIEKAQRNGDGDGDGDNDDDSERKTDGLTR
jgi:hypothetical protein